MAQELANTRSDPYAAYGARTAQDGIFLVFSKGFYRFGPNKDELAIGTRLVANMPGLRAGWKCWKNGKVTHDRTHLVSDGVKEEDRADLGDEDQGLWELDDRNEPRDPWVLTNILEMANQETGDVFVFSTNSSGGRRAIGKLCKEYARAYRMRPGMLPVVELGRDSYQHKNRRFGTIENPVFRIVDWVEDGAADAGQLSLSDHREPGEDDVLPYDDTPFDDPAPRNPVRGTPRY